MAELPASAKAAPLRTGESPGAMSGVLRTMASLPEVIAGLLMVAVTILLFLQTAFRYVLFVPIGWAEEAARIGLIWLTFLGATVCSRRGLHSRFTILFDRVPPPLRRGMGALSDLVTVLFAGIMMVKGWDMVQHSWYERWIMLDVPMAYTYLAIPVAGALIALDTLRRLRRPGLAVAAGEGGFVALAALGSVATVLVLAGTPIAFMLGASVSAGLLAEGKTDLILIPTKMLEGVDSFVLLAIPLFIFAGALMDVGGISVRIMRFARALVGHFHGGLPMTAVVSEMLFSVISGSTMADASAIRSEERRVGKECRSRGTPSP